MSDSIASDSTIASDPGAEFLGELMDDSDEDPHFDPRKEGGKMWDVESSDSGEDDEDIRAAIAESRALMAMRLPGARRDGAGPSSAPDPPGQRRRRC